MNGIKELIERHLESTDDMTFESVMCGFALETLERLEKLEKGRWKTVLLVGAVAVVPIVIVLLDKIL